MEDNALAEVPMNEGRGHRRAPALRAEVGMTCATLSPPETVDILDTPVAAVDAASFLHIIEAWLARRSSATEGVYVVFRDVHGVVRARDDPALAEAHRRAFMNVPDGAPLVWVCRLRGRRAGRVTGTETLNAVCAAGQAKGWRHAFYGSRPEVLDALAHGLRAAHPGIRIVEIISPANWPLTDAETNDHLRRLAASRPDFVWVGLGCPKQEIWMAQHARRLPGTIAMGVGAAFDFRAGTVRRAPAPVRRVGLEFLYRIAQEPKRLAGRYARIIPTFVLGLIAEEATRRLWPGAASSGSIRPPSPSGDSQQPADHSASLKTNRTSTPSK